MIQLVGIAVVPDLDSSRSLSHQYVDVALLSSDEITSVMMIMIIIIIMDYAVDTTGLIIMSGTFVGKKPDP